MKRLNLKKPWNPWPGRKKAVWLRLAAVLFALLLCAPGAARAAPGQDCATGQHQYKEIERVPATALEDGEVTYLCSLCGQQYTEILFATSHLWGAWVIDKKPTCTEAGERHRTCTRAQPHDGFEVIPALGHDYVESVTTKPGCEKDGVKTFACSRCGDAYTEPIAQLGHSFIETVSLEPSCLEPGLTTFICENDPAHTHEEEIPAIGHHQFGEWYVETPAEEGTAGVEARVCTLDGFKETRELAALPLEDESPPILDIVLIGANIGSAAFCTTSLARYATCLKHIKKRRDAVALRNALRREVEKLYGFR